MTREGSLKKWGGAPERIVMTAAGIGTILAAFVAAAGGVIIAHSDDVNGRGGLSWQVCLGELLLFGGFMAAVLINFW